MKGSFLWKLAYVFCALAGILAGYGIVSLTSAGEKDITKDSTLVREAGDSVFFDERTDIAHEEEKAPSKPQEPMVTSIPEETPMPVVTAIPAVSVTPTVQPEEVLPELPEITTVPEETVSAGQAFATTDEEVLPSLGSQWAGNGSAVVPDRKIEEKINNMAATDNERSNENTEDELQEVFTYPVKIFGQTPIINRSDAYVSYFEFCYDLIAMVEQEVAARGLNINVLMTKFALKALLCGVDIEKLDINAPIPRRLAALCLWLAAQVLNESGCDTSSQSAGMYVTDISACSSSERKAVAYLYEQGIIKGYQTAGQRFYPEDGLKNEDGKSWLLAIKQCWN